VASIITNVNTNNSIGLSFWSCPQVDNMKKEKYSRHNIYLQDKQWKAMKKLAHKKDITISELIRMTIRNIYNV